MLEKERYYRYIHDLDSLRKDFAKLCLTLQEMVLQHTSRDGSL